MIDLTLLRTDSSTIIRLLKKKDPDFDGKRLVELDARVLQLKSDVEALRHKKNELAKEGRGGVTAELREQSATVGKSLKEREAELCNVEQEFMELYLACPNIPYDDVPEGGDNDFRIVREFGKQPIIQFEAKNHLELGKQLGWFDFESGAISSGSGFPFYTGQGARLIYSLAMYMLKHNMNHGYQLIIPPFMVNEQSLYVSGNFPKFKDGVYAIQEDGLYTIPTSEVCLVNFYRDKILSKEQLPVRMTAWTSCFRREAGTYGAQERGLIRMHQFEKVELVTITDPNSSAQELDNMIACAEGILRALDLHYRISLLAGQGCSFQSAKTYDIEVWFPVQKQYREVSSCSNCTDFQARRGKIRYREKADGKTQLVHTLNASSLAIPRLMVALMETYQQEDGTICLPDILTSAIQPL